MKTMPKELKKIRPDSTIPWNPQVLDDWMLENGIGKEWLATTIGKNKFYIYNCASRGRIGRDALDEIVNLTGLDKDLLKMPKETEEVKEIPPKPEGVNEDRVSWEEFHGYNKKPEEPKIYTAPAADFGIPDQEPPACMEMPKAKMPEGWIILAGIETNYFVRVSDIVQVREMMNGSQVITQHGTFNVINRGWEIMERMEG